MIVIVIGQLARLMNMYTHVLSTDTRVHIRSVSISSDDTETKCFIQQMIVSTTNDDIARTDADDYMENTVRMWPVWTSGVKVKRTKLAYHLTPIN